jgi:oligopeptide transport system substrate-binding protein
MRKHGLWAVMIAILVGVILTVAACGGDDDDDAADAGGDSGGAAGGTMVDLQNFVFGDPDHIDPALAGVLEGAQIGVLLYDGLTEFDYSDRENPVLEGQVASDWTTPDNGKTWVFNIKEGQVFSNGEPVLPSSFKRGWERVSAADTASEIAYLMAPIKGQAELNAGEAQVLSGVVADDAARTLTVTLNFPFADFPSVVSHPLYSPMPKAVDALADTTQWEQGVMIGNGPFVMKGPWRHNRAITLARNDKWNSGIYETGTKTKLDEIEFRISKDIDSAYADFEAGNGDTARIPSGRFTEATTNYPNVTDPNLGVYIFYINMESALGGEKNLKLRQALSMAIDRDSINNTVYDGARVNATSITPPAVPGFEAGLCENCTYDPDQARTLIEEWKAEGGKLDKPIKLSFNTGSGHEDVVAIIQANLKDVGLEAQLDGGDPTNYFTEMRQGACEFCRAGWIWDYPVYDSVTSMFLTSSIDGDNIARFSSKTVDKAVDDARATADDEDRYALYRQAEKEALDSGAYVPINWYTQQIVYRDTLGDFADTPLQFVLYENITKGGES